MSINIGLDKTIRQQLSQQLNLLLADTYVLYTKTQNFHWNIVDPRFYFLHLFLEELYKELAEDIDELAERIRMLGGRSPGTLKQFLDMTSLKETVKELSGNEMLQKLLSDHESLCCLVREKIELTGQLDDEGTKDLLIKKLRFHEKSAWMLRSHLENLN